ncbi:MAG: hypothetical protein JJ916_12375 [Phycisphaerales bacterium]|nr:hypothetical protein [Phycisphaerales bacterium]
MQDPFVAKRVAMRAQRKELKKRLWLWFAALVLVAAHVLFYVYFSEITTFLESSRDVMLDRIGENNNVVQ